VLLRESPECANLPLLAMWNGARVTVVVPAFNEAKRIAAVLRGMPDFVDQVVVVDDASADDTAQVARSVQDVRVVVLRHPKNAGVGAAIVSGYRHALVAPGETSPRDVFVVMAGDGQMAPEDLARVVEPVADGRFDYVKGERFTDAQVRTVMPSPRYWGGRVFSALTSRALGQTIHDSQCGFTAIARGTCARLPLDEVWPGFGYPNDLLLTLGRLGARLGEVPVKACYPHDESKLRLWHVPMVAYVIGRGALRRLR
jgi:glycosyltransferase involved in cell wall biosynthesis